MNERIVVLDDDPGVVEFLCEELRQRGYRTLGLTSPRAVLDHVCANETDLLIADVEMPEMRGIDLLNAVLAEQHDQLVLLMTAFGSIDLAVQAVRAGACDFVAKPFHVETLCVAIERSLRERQMRREIIRLRSALPVADGGLVARSPGMRRILDLASRASGCDVTVLLTGESGTGKGAIARYIHDHSARARMPFLVLNCAALPANLVETELFGARKGAYTDAREDRRGLFEAAAGGTLVLDEIGELALDIQAKLLRVLESNRVRPLGGTVEIAVTARIIAATNQPLEALLRAGRFRPDLYYRLNVIRLDVPPLRERRDDILPLVDCLLHRSAERLGRPIVGFSAAALRRVLRYDWPGNVRELANAIERAVAMTDYDTIVPDDLHVAGPWRGDAIAAAMAAAATRDVPLADVARAYVLATMEWHRGNKAAAARALGIDRRTLYRMMSRGADPEDADPDDTRAYRGARDTAKSTRGETPGPPAD